VIVLTATFDRCESPQLGLSAAASVKLAAKAKRHFLRSRGERNGEGRNVLISFSPNALEASSWLAQTFEGSVVTKGLSLGRGWPGSAPDHLVERQADVRL
jgi:hypothetical protein